MCCIKRKKCLQTCVKFRFRSSCTCAKNNLGLCSPFIHSVVSNDSVSIQWRAWSECTYAQAYLGLHCPQILEATLFTWCGPSNSYDVKNIALDKWCIQINIFLIFQQKHMLWVSRRMALAKAKAILLGTHNICFCGEVRKISILFWQRKHFSGATERNNWNYPYVPVS